MALINQITGRLLQQLGGSTGSGGTGSSTINGLGVGASFGGSAVNLSLSVSSLQSAFQDSALRINQPSTAFTASAEILTELLELTDKLVSLARRAASEGSSSEERAVSNTKFQATVNKFRQLLDKSAASGVDLRSKSDLEALLKEAGVDTGSASQLAEFFRNIAPLDGEIGYSKIKGEDVVVSRIITTTTFTSEGSGTFRAESSFATVTNPFEVKLEDFNRDGILDLISAGLSQDYFTLQLGAGDGSFGSALTLNVASGFSYNIESFDYNRDGSLDIAALETSVVLANGDGSFTAAASYTATWLGNDIISFDANRDGKLDLIASSSSGDLSVSFGNGDGTYLLPSDYVSPGSLGQLDYGDFNHDGVIDVIAGDQTLAAVQLFLGCADGTFQAPICFTTTTSTVDYLAVGDFNNDSHLDFVTAKNGAAFQDIELFVGDGSGGFTGGSVFQAAAAGQSISSLAVSDLNRDGALDIVAGNEASTGIHVLMGTGSGSFGTAVSFVSSTGAAIDKVVISDISGDGRLDLVTMSPGVGNTVQMYIGNGNGTFNLPTVANFGSDLVDLAVLDHNGDGLKDYLTLSSTGTVNLLLGNPSVYFSPFPAASYNASAGSAAFVVEDLNRDGQTDVATIAYTVGDGSHQILLGNSFQNPVSIKTELNYVTPGGINDVHLFDTNSDGRDDLVYTSVSNKRIYVALGNTDGSFAAATQTSLPEVTTASTAGDINHDGRTDMVVVVDEGTFTVQTYFGTGAGTFTAGNSYVAGSSNEMKLVDIDHDGNLDLISAAQGSNTAVYLGNSNGSFRARVNYATGATAQSIELADLDGDGNLDLVTGTSDDYLSVRLGTGSGTFGAATTVDQVDDTRDLELRDFDGDGDIDIAALSFADSSITVFKGNGDGTFASASAETFSVGSASLSMTSVDYDRDGNFDLLATLGSEDGFAILTGNADGSFNSRTFIGTADNPTSIIARDLNRDGRVDVVTASINTTGGFNVALAGETARLNLFSGNGDGTFDAAQTVIMTNATYLYRGDVNRDGIEDLVTGDSPAKTASVYLGNGDGSFQARRSIALGGDPVRFYLNDLNRDGNLDIVADTTDGKIVRMLGNGDGTFRASVSYGIGAAMYELAFADLNRDGITDIVAGTASHSALSIFIGNGDGSFAAPTSLVGSSTPASLSIEDFNADGSLDILATGTASARVDLFLGNGDGTFQGKQSFASVAPFTIETGDLDRDGSFDLIETNLVGSTLHVRLGNSNSYTGSFQNRTTVAAGSNINEIASGDFNRDGRIDLVSSDELNQKLNVRLGNGDGTFQASVSYEAGLRPEDIVVGDFNRDGVSDLVTTDGSTGKYRILLGNSDGSFQASVSYEAALDIENMEAADVNRDGVLDLLGQKTATGEVVVSLGNGDGTFNSPSTIDGGLGAGVAELNLSDVNADGSLDLIYSRSAGAFSVSFGNGNGTFLAAVSYQTNLAQEEVELADVNRDGITDLVSTNSAADKVSVYLGNADGSFAGPRTFYAGDTPEALALADTNADGILDIVTAASGDSRYNVLVGNGDGSFKAAVSYYGGIGAEEVLFTDVNRDGRADIVGYSSSSHTYDILLSPGESGSTVTTIGLEVAIAGTSTDPLSQNLQTRGGATIALDTLEKLQRDVLKDSKGVKGVLDELRGALRFAAAGATASSRISDRITSYNNATELAADLATRIRALANDPGIARHSELDRILVNQLLKG